MATRQRPPAEPQQYNPPKAPRQPAPTGRLDHHIPIRDVGVFAPPPPPPPLPPGPVPLTLPDDRLAAVGFEGAWPALLLPVRLETRWMPGAEAGALELRVRLFPDVLHVASERGAIEVDEHARARAFLDAASDDARRSAWDDLVRLRGVAHASGVVQRVRAGEPAASAGADTFGDAVTAAHLMPTRFALVLHGDFGHRVAWGADLPAELPAGVADPGDATTRWQFDFTAAESAGLALRVPFDAASAAGLRRIVALGLREGTPAAQAQALAAHLARQAGSAGAELLEAGTPTNNTEESPSGFDARSRGDAQRLALSQLDAPLATDCDGALLARALGLDETIWRALPGARARAAAEAGAMHAALWPGTLGTWLRRLIAPGLPASARQFVQDLFIDDVRARGPWPTLRIGRQPYGLLPATSLARWQASDGTLRAARMLHELRAHWQAAAAPPTLHAGGDESTLRAALATLPSSRRVALRRLRPSTLRGGPAVMGAIRRWAALAPMFERWGIPDKPPIAAMFHDPETHWSSLPMVAPATADRALPLPDDVLQALAGPLDGLAVRSHAALGSAAPSLLYVLARAGMLEQALDLVEELFGVTTEEVRDHRVDPPETRVVRAWRMLSVAHPRLDNRSIAQAMALVPTLPQLISAIGPEWVRLLDPVRRQRAGLAQLARLPVGRLEALLHEALDVAGYRLDAWAGALATHRLRQLRKTQPTGLHLGAWGWVGAPPLPAIPGAPARSDGFELAPSLAHARTAAVLRSGFVHHRLSQPGAEGMEVDIASARVRAAIDLLALVRAGQGMGEVLGRRLERWLVDHGLGPRLPALRDQAPLAGARFGIDGVQLDAHWNAQPPDAALAEAALTLRGWIDGVADLMLAEGAHQLVNGRRARARAAIEAIERGEVLPGELEVAMGPRASEAAEWQLAVALPTSDGWSGAAGSVRAAAAPALEAWAGRCLGAPEALQWIVSGRNAAGDATEVSVSAQQLALSALDAVVLSRRAGDLAALASRVARGQGLAQIDALVESPTLQAALRVARRLAALLDGTAQAAEAPAGVARAEAALTNLRTEGARTALLRAAWTGEDTEPAAIDARLAAAPADAGERLLALTGLRCAGAPALELAAAEPDLAAALGAPAISAWLHDLGRVRPQVAWLSALVLARPAQFAGAWSVHLAADGMRTVLIGAPAAAGTVSALVLDRWREQVPLPEAEAALAVNVDAPRSRAPQAMLLAVSPVPNEAWSLSALAEIVFETLDMLPLRLVPPGALAGQYLPALHVADDLDGEAFGTLARSQVRPVPR